MSEQSTFVVLSSGLRRMYYSNNEKHGNLLRKQEIERSNLERNLRYKATHGYISNNDIYIYMEKLLNKQKEERDSTLSLVNSVKNITNEMSFIDERSVNNIEKSLSNIRSSENIILDSNYNNRLLVNHESSKDEIRSDMRTSSLEDIDISAIPSFRTSISDSDNYNDYIRGMLERSKMDNPFENHKYTL